MLPVVKVKAIYENGLLRPLTPIKLEESQTVSLEIKLDQPVDRSEEAIQMMVNEGLLTLPSGLSDIEPLTEEEELELAERIGKAPGKPLSEIIIEERGEW
jgi:predicted DNA-binding antitoxin AbrB/MazE fold protein